MKVHVVWALVVACIVAVAPVARAGGPSGPQLATYPSRLVTQYVQEGGEYYQRREYKKAIGPYSRALELEKKNPTLNKAQWRVLVDSLGLCYGLTGDLVRAKATFEYGLGQDGTCPTFYYSLACVYGEMKDLENAIANLKLAFKYKDNMILGLKLPDPSKDDSFRGFLTDDRFREVVRELGFGDK